MGLNRLFRSRLQPQKRRNQCEDQRGKKPSKRASLMPLRWKKQRLRISLMKGRKKRRRRQKRLLSSQPLFQLRRSLRQTRRKKKDDDEPADNLFDGVPEAKPKVKDEFTDKDKKPKEEEKIVIKPAVLPTKAEESSSDEEEEEKPAPKKKLSAADLKPAVSN